MGRPQRHNVDYFPLYLDTGFKMNSIQTKYGNDGYATWMKLLCEIGKADDHYLDLRDEDNLIYLSAICLLDSKKVKTLISIIDDLVRLKQFDADLWKDGILFSEKFVESVSVVYDRRQNDSPTKENIRTRIPGLGEQKTSKGEQKGSKSAQKALKDSIVKDSIVKDSIVKDSTADAVLFRQSGISTEDLRQHFATHHSFGIADKDYYHKAVTDWSNKKGIKHENWLDIVESFMSRDLKENKLRVDNKPPAADPRCGDLENNPDFVR